MDGVVLVGVAAPTLLITWVIEPTLPSETVSRSWNCTPELFGASNAWSLTTAGLTFADTVAISRVVPDEADPEPPGRNGRPAPDRR